MKEKNIIENFKEIREEYPILLLYIVGNFINSILLCVFTTGHFLLRGGLINFGFLLALGAFSFVVNKKRRKLYFGITTLLMVATCAINSIYYNYYNSYVSISLISTSVFVKDVGDAVMDMVFRPCDLTYFWILIAMGFAFKKYKLDSGKNKKYFAQLFLLGFVFAGIGMPLPPYNVFPGFFKLWNRVAALEGFGPYIYQIDDIVQSLKPAFNNIFGYDKALKDTKDYYSLKGRGISNNEYSNIFQGKNVIVIHAESLQSYTLGLKINQQEITPNVSKLASEGMYFSNFYAQVGVGTSSDTEFTYATSLLPSNNGTVFVNYFNDKFITMQNLLKDKGYYVFSMHGNVGDFWNREVMHNTMGYDKLYSKSSFDIDLEYGLGLADESFFRQVVPMIKEINDEVGKPYYGTLITLTNHTPWEDADKYSDMDLSMTARVNGEVVKRDYLEDKAIGRYFKSVNYMDKAIGKFISDMDEAGLLDNTVIVIYGDHDARIGLKDYQYMYNYDPVTDSVRNSDDSKYVEFNNYDYELNKKVPFIIWTKDMTENVEIDTPMGMIDVLPTLGNMLGVNSKYALGNDVMSLDKEDAIVVLKDGSFITDKVYYNARNGEVYAISGGVIGNNYINEKISYAEEVIEISNNIITYDLIRKLEP